MIKPIYEDLSTKYDGKISFGKVDIDDNSDAATAAGIRSVPTFIFRDGKGGKETFSGADKKMLEANLEKLLK